MDNLITNLQDIDLISNTIFRFYLNGSKYFLYLSLVENNIEFLLKEDGVTARFKGIKSFYDLTKNDMFSGCNSHIDIIDKINYLFSKGFVILEAINNSFHFLKLFEQLNTKVYKIDIELRCQNS
jgi:hypothetical protein